MHVRTLRRTCLKLRHSRTSIEDYGDWYVASSYSMDDDLVRLANYATIKREVTDLGEHFAEIEAALGGHVLLLSPDAEHTRAAVEKMRVFAADGRIIDPDHYEQLRQTTAFDTWHMMPIHMRIAACLDTDTEISSAVLPDLPSSAKGQLLRRILDTRQRLLT